MIDLTNIDLNRRELQILKDKVRESLPSFFVDEYPLFIKFLDYYYEYLFTSDYSVKLLNDLIKSRDIYQVNEAFLTFIEDELLLGDSYFKGFQDRRQAAYYSNNLYRSKGSSFSIQQFFRTFYGVDAEAIYTKRNVFIVGDDYKENDEIFTDTFNGASLTLNTFPISGETKQFVRTQSWQLSYGGSVITDEKYSFDSEGRDTITITFNDSSGLPYHDKEITIISRVESIFNTASKIGSESQKYLTNDKLYQTFAVLIKTSLPKSLWEDSYKLFVHPAGIYLGSEILLVSEANLNITAPIVILDSAANILSITDQSSISLGAITEITGVVS